MRLIKQFITFQTGNSLRWFALSEINWCIANYRYWNATRGTWSIISVNRVKKSLLQVHLLLWLNSFFSFTWKMMLNKHMDSDVHCYCPFFVYISINGISYMEDSLCCVCCALSFYDESRDRITCTRQTKSSLYEIIRNQLKSA